MNAATSADAAMQKYRKECAKFFGQIYVGENRILVFGEGAIGAKLMLIGEAPGEEETLAGRPFMGKAGRNIDKFLEDVRLDRSQVYISNAVKVRPTKINAKGRVTNRPPTREEISLFQPWLAREIALVKPQAIATLGNVALYAVTGRAQSIGQAHGRWIELDGLPPLFPLYHPAGILFNPALAELYAQDVRALSLCLAGDQALSNDILAPETHH